MAYEFNIQTDIMNQNKKQRKEMGLWNLHCEELGPRLIWMR